MPVLPPKYCLRLKRQYLRNVAKLAQWEPRFVCHPISRQPPKFFCPETPGLWSLADRHCPLDGGAIAISHSGDLTTVWRRDKEILTTLPGHNAEVSFGREEQPWVACDKRRNWITWFAPRGGKLFLQHLGTGRPEVISQHAADPMIAASVFDKFPVVLV